MQSIIFFFIELYSRLNSELLIFVIRKSHIFHNIDHNIKKIQIYNILIPRYNYVEHFFFF